MGAPGEAPEYNPQPYLAELDGLRERGTRLRLTGAVSILIVVTAAITLLIIAYLAPGADDHSPTALVLGLCSLVVVTGVVAYIAYIMGLHQVTQRLRHSGLFEVLAWGRAGTYPPLEGYFQDPSPLGHDRGNLQELLNYIADNLGRVVSQRLGVGMEFSTIVQATVPFVITCVLALGMILHSTVDTSALPALLHCLLPITCTAIVRLLVQRGRLCHILADYIADRQAEYSERPDSPPAPVNPGLLLLVNRLDEDLALGLRNLVFTAAFLTGLPVCLAWLLLNSAWVSSLSGPEFLTALSFELIITFTIFVLAPYFVAFRQAHGIENLLESSDLIIRVIGGDGETADVVQSVPLALRHHLGFPRMPDDYHGGLGELLWKIAGNLDWYLNPARVLVRPGWFTGYILILTNCMLVMAYFGSFSVLPYNMDLNLLILLSASFLTAVVLIHDVARKHLWARLMVRHLRDLIG